MEDGISIENATFGLMGPITHTPTRAMPCHCVIFHIGKRIVLLDSGFGTREIWNRIVCSVTMRFSNSGMSSICA